MMLTTDALLVPDRVAAPRRVGRRGAGDGPAVPRRPSPGGLWALGLIVRGVFWECTAVPDIRLQARLIATELAQLVLSLSMPAETRSVRTE